MSGFFQRYGEEKKLKWYTFTGTTGTLYFGLGGTLSPKSSVEENNCRKIGVLQQKTIFDSSFIRSMQKDIDYEQRVKNRPGNLAEPINLLSLSNEIRNGNYERVKEIAGRIAEGTSAITRLNRKEEQGRIGGGRIAIEASLVAGAADRASRERQGSYRFGEGSEVAQEEALRQYAQSEDGNLYFIDTVITLNPAEDKLGGVREYGDF